MTDYTTPTSQHFNALHNVMVMQFDHDDYLQTYYVGHDDVFPHEIEQLNMLFIRQYVNLEDGLFGNDVKIVVHKIKNVLDGVGQNNVDYCLEFKRPPVLLCKREHLAEGDTIRMGHGDRIYLDANHDLLKPVKEQGYYRYELVGGEKYEMFLDDAKSVSIESIMHRAHLWKGKRNG